MRVFYLQFRDFSNGPDGIQLCPVIAINETEAVNAARKEFPELQELELIQVEDIQVKAGAIIGCWGMTESPF
ncbi:MAG: hypothetical protein MN733_36630 [Nitrososphaera sp.]|nr:hypothetical protein [Nitrososphaera sp.]